MAREKEWNEADGQERRRNTPTGEARDVAGEILVREERRRVLWQLAVEFLVKSLCTSCKYCTVIMKYAVCITPVDSFIISDCVYVLLLLLLT